MLLVLGCGYNGRWLTRYATIVRTVHVISAFNSRFAVKSTFTDDPHGGQQAERGYGDELTPDGRRRPGPHPSPYDDPPEGSAPVEPAASMRERCPYVGGQGITAAPPAFKMCAPAGSVVLGFAGRGDHIPTLTM